jgi:hypothetical protein
MVECGNCRASLDDVMWSLSSGRARVRATRWHRRENHEATKCLIVIRPKWNNLYPCGFESDASDSARVRK